MQKTDGRGLAYAWIAIATAVSVVGMSSHAADSPSFNAAPVMVAQAAAPSIDKIRAQSQRMKEYRALLADPDSNVRLALPLPVKNRWTFVSHSSTVRDGTTAPDQAHVSSS